MSERRPSETIGRRLRSRRPSTGARRRRAPNASSRRSSSASTGRGSSGRADQAAREAGPRRERRTSQPFAEEWLDRRRVLGGRRGTGPVHEWQTTTSRGGSGTSTAWFGGLRLNEITEEEVERYATAKRARAGKGGRPERDEHEQDALRRWKRSSTPPSGYRKIERNAVAGYRVPSAQVRRRDPGHGSADDGAPRRGGRARRVSVASDTATGARFSRRSSTAACGSTRRSALRWRDVRLPDRQRRRGAAAPRGRRGRLDEDPRRQDRECGAGQWTCSRRLSAELAELQARRGGDRDALDLRRPRRGGKDSPSNVRRRLLANAIESANTALENGGVRRRSRSA